MSSDVNIFRAYGLDNSGSPKVASVTGSNWLSLSQYYFPFNAAILKHFVEGINLSNSYLSWI